MTTAYYKSVQNYTRPQSTRPVHVPQPFLNYQGLSQMMKADYKSPLEEKNNPRGTSIKGMFIIEGGKSRPFDDSIDLGDDHSKGK